MQAIDTYLSPVKPYSAQEDRSMGKWILIIGVLLALLSDYTLASLFSAVCLFLLYTMFWTRRQPAVLFWALLHQWLQVNIALIYSTITGQDFTELFRYRENAWNAYWLGISGWLAFSLGLWCMMRRTTHIPIQNWAIKLSPEKCLKLYVAFLAINIALPYFPIPGLGQLIIALSMLKWGFFYLFFAASMTTGRHKKTLLALILIEFLSSFFSIFSEFKSIIIILMILLPAFLKNRIGFRNILLIFAIGSTLVTLGLVWTAVKSEYREFLSGGQKGQVINVSRNEAMTELGKLISQTDSEAISNAIPDMVSRISYLDYLSGTIGNVPKTLPHEGGEITKSAILHILMPRIFFPNKEEIHDSLHTNKYVGEYVADYRTTSISIGYVGDLYIDFGYMAPVAVFLDGLLIGFLYRFLFRQDKEAGWGLFLTIPLFFIVYLFETALIRQVSMVVTYAVVILAFSKLALPSIKRRLEKNPMLLASERRA
jgi:hypothetical protein